MSSLPIPSLGAAGADGSTEGFAPYAVRTRSGPHVTIQAGVVHAGRFWTTTSRPSLKARSVRAHRYASVLVREPGEAHRLIAGPTVSLDLTRPLDVLADPVAPVFAPGAVLRLGREHLRQVLGYLEAATSIPSGWYPQNRVLLVTDIDRSLTLDRNHVVDADGAWDRRRRAVRAGNANPIALPRRVGGHDLQPLLDGSHPVHVGVTTPEGPVALPATWQPDGTVAVSSGALGALHAAFPAPACIVVDDSTSRRPDEKRGVMFRGEGHVLDVHRGVVTLMVDTDRVTIWDGFDADTVDVSADRARSA